MYAQGNFWQSPQKLASDNAGAAWKIPQQCELYKSVLLKWLITLFQYPHQSSPAHLLLYYKSASPHVAWHQNTTSRNKQPKHENLHRLSAKISQYPIPGIPQNAWLYCIYIGQNGSFGLQDGISKFSYYGIPQNGSFCLWIALIAHSIPWIPVLHATNGGFLEWGYHYWSSISRWNFPWNKPSSELGVPPWLWKPHFLVDD